MSQNIVPTVELLWWSGCPSHGRALDLLREAMLDAGLDPDSIRRRQVVGQQEAEQLGFIGSPTIRINGSDVIDVDPDTPHLLTCRVYRRRDGRISPVPDPDDVRAALNAAVTS